MATLTEVKNKGDNGWGGTTTFLKRLFVLVEERQQKRIKSETEEK